MVHEQTIMAVAKTESSFNQFAIGVVGARLARQPQNLAEAIATVENLERLGYNFSAGYLQVNKTNFQKYGLTRRTVFDPCSNLRAGGQILAECYERGMKRFNNEKQALLASFSCYYSGNFSTGFRPDFRGQPSYVDKVRGNAVPVPLGAAIPVYRTMTVAAQ